MVQFPSKPSKPGLNAKNPGFKKSPIDGPVPGESLTLPPRTYPFDRPPQFVEADKALNDIFKKLMTPKVAKKTLAMLDTGMPIMTATEQILQMGWSEGKYSVQILPQMAAPIALMLAKMAHEAGIKANYTKEDLVKDGKKKKEIDPALIAAARSKRTRQKQNEKDIPGGGLMSPPKLEGEQ